MKILHIANGDDRLGSAKCLYEILEYENKNKNLVPVVITPFRNRMNNWCDENGIENHVIHHVGSMYPAHKKRYKLKYLIRKIQYELFIKSIKNKLKKLSFLDDIDLVHTNNCTTELGCIISKMFNINHIWHLREGGLYQFNYKPYRKDFINKMKLGATYFVAVSFAVKEEWVRLGIPKDQIKMIYDGVNHPNKELVNYRSNNEISFIMSGSYSEAKGQVQLIEAVAKLPNSYKARIKVDFWGIGLTNYVENMKLKIQKYKLNNIILINDYAENIWNILGNYDIGINCTRFEAFGRCTVEYLMSGLPVIAADLGANKELINPDNGLIYHYNDIDDLKDKIMFIMDNIHVYRKNKMSISINALNNFSCQKSTKNLIDLFKSI